MGSIPLPALDIRNQQEPDTLQKYGQLMALRNMQQQTALQQQEAPLRLHALQQQTQQGQLGLQQQQQALKDDQTFRSAMQDPSLQGKTIGQIADVLAQKGQISQAGWANAKKQDLEHQEAVQKLTTEKLANVKAAHDQTQQLYSSVQNLPDDQVAANWPQIVQQIKAIPGNENIQLNPAQPMTKQQLSQFGPLLSVANGYLDQEIARREAAAKAKTAEQTAEAGGTTDLAKFQQDYLKSNNLENTPANRQKAFDVYNQKTKIAPAQVRSETFLQMPQAIADPNNPGQTIFVSRKDAIGQEAPNSGDVKAVQATQKYFSPAGKGGQSLAAFNTAQNHMQLLGQASEALNNGNMTLFNSVANKFAKATGSDAPTNFDAVKNALKGEVAKALTGNVTVSEQAELDKDFNNASSPKQIQGIVQKYTQLMQGKKDVLHQQYVDGMKGKVSFDDNSSGSGLTVKAPNGKTYTFKDQQSADNFKKNAGIQ